MSEQEELSKPSERQLELLRVVHTYSIEQGYSPSRRDLAEKLGVKSIHTVQGLVDLLVEKGFLLRQPRISRSLSLTARGKELLV
jgi:SOS-response transcriptional repressor LexA